MDSAMRAFDAFAACAQHPGILLFYAGEFTPELISAAAERLRQRLLEQTQGEHSPSRQRLLSTFKVMAQHVLSCAAPVGQPAQRLGRIAVGRLGEHFWVLCASRIDARQRAQLSAGLDAARALGTAPAGLDSAAPDSAAEPHFDAPFDTPFASSFDTPFAPHFESHFDTAIDKPQTAGPQTAPAAPDMRTEDLPLGHAPGWLRVARASSAPLEYGFFCGPLQDGAPCTHLHVRAWI